MKLKVEPPRRIAGETLRMVVAIDAEARRLFGRGVWARGASHPVAVVFGSGAGARLVRLDGAACAPEDLGLTPDDIA